MTKVKYYFDSENLVYKRIVNTFYSRLKKVSAFFISSLLLAIVVIFILYRVSFIQTPREIFQDRELEQYELQFKLLNKKIEQLEAVISNIAERDNNLYRLYFEASPLPEDQRRAGFGGINRYKALEGYKNSEIVIETTKRLEMLQRQAVVQSKSLDEITKLAQNKERLLAAIPAIQPINTKNLTRMASGFGMRIDPFTKAPKMHWGMDFSAPAGTPVYASGDGVVERADNKSSGYGNHIRINHGYGYVSLYAHLKGYKTSAGRHVKRGEVIGYVGSTGRSQAPHLHYEIFKNGQKINPINFYYGSLTAEEYSEMLNIATQENQSLD